MKRLLLSASTLVLLSACASHPPPRVSSGEDAAQPVAIVLPEDAHDSEPLLRQPGDYVVHRFSGSYRKQSVTLTQRVIERQGNHLILDITIDDGRSATKLRARIDDSGGNGGELMSVARLDGNVQRPFGVPAFEKLMNELVLGVDDNQGIIDSRPVTVHLPNGELACTRTSYRVRVGARDAIMRTIASEGFAWGDVGGEITTTDGKLIYKAEVIDIGGNATRLRNGDEVYGELEEIE
jgi:hypothetical protein